MIIELRRAELYAQVWRHPVGPLSARLGMSSAKLRQACKVMSIPLPPLGHWQKIVAPAAPALLPHDGPDSFVIGTPPRTTTVDQSKSTRVDSPAKAPVGGPQAPAAPRYITLDQWAISMFGDHKPHFNTLRKWVNEGRIQPQPRKIGIRWWVPATAEYVED